MSAYDEYMSQYQNATSDEDAWNIGGFFGVDSGHTQRLNYLSQQAQNAYNAEQAQIQRDWEAEMSNTAYQRQAEDMRKAGLNPYLAYGQGGASTPSGASAHSSAYGASHGIGSGASIINSVVRFGLDSALEAMQSKRDEKNRSIVKRLIGLFKNR